MVHSSLLTDGHRFCYAGDMNYSVNILGAGLAGSEAALQLGHRGVSVRLFEMRPRVSTPVHETGDFAELVCSNSFKSMKPESAAGMLKAELMALDSFLLDYAYANRVDAGGALAVDRKKFSSAVNEAVHSCEYIEVIREEVKDLPSDACATIVATGPLTSDALSDSIARLTGSEHLAFYDAAAPIVMADTLDYEKLFFQSRYEDKQGGDYVNAPFTRQEYDDFISELCTAERVILREFENKDLFQACQPIEELARKGFDAPRYGPFKPVGLRDPQTNTRPWAALQLRAENSHKTSFNLVGCQTNLTFSEQRRVFRMIPGLERAEFTRYGVMHRNTFINSPQLLDEHLKYTGTGQGYDTCPLYFAGQIGGTEGYSEAIMSGLWAALSVYAYLTGANLPALPETTAFGSLLSYATHPDTVGYQPMHVNFGIIPPLEHPVKNKALRYASYAQRGKDALEAFVNSISPIRLPRAQ